MPAVCWILLLAALPASAQQGMGSGTKVHPRASAKAAIHRKLPPTDFRDVAAAWGITAPNLYGGERSKKHILEMTGNGVALIDFNNDQRLDVLLLNGARLDGATARHTLYENLGGNRFRDASATSGFDRTGWAQGVCAGDIDNDGWIDLAITSYGSIAIYRNEKGRFREAALLAEGQYFHTGCALLDYDRDGRLDLVAANYVSFPMAQARAAAATCNWRGVSVFCGPRGFPTGIMHLFRNAGGFRWEDTSAKAGIRVPGVFYGLGVVSGDFDDDGWPDIFIACDSTPSLLYRNNHDGTFTESAVLAGVAYGENGEEQGGMGAAAGDFDNDGRIDIVRSNFIDETTTSLYRNDGGLAFTDVTLSSGLAINTRFVAWGLGWLDFDQDGFRDLILANGHIYPELAAARTPESYEQSRLLYWNLGNGAFRDVTAAAGPGLQVRRSSRGLAIGDLDGDGAPEVVIGNMNAAPTVLHNDGDRGNGMLFDVGLATGTRVTVKAGALRQTAEVQSGSGYLSQSDLRLHFGLGAAAQVDEAVIRWPDGTVETLRAIPANHTVRVVQGKGITSRIPFARRAAPPSAPARPPVRPAADGGAPGGAASPVRPPR